MSPKCMLLLLNTLESCGSGIKWLFEIFLEPITWFKDYFFNSPLQETKNYHFVDSDQSWVCM